MKKQTFSISAVTLRNIALVCMLLDHLWATVVPGNFWMTCLGRLAFPIFAFQIVEGYVHTSNFKKYAQRLLLFGLLSELPFNLIYSGSLIFPFHQNVMFTLLLGLLSARDLDQFRQAEDFKQRIVAVLRMMLWCGLGAIGFVDYGANGVLTVLLFAMCRQLPHCRLFQLAGMVVLHGFLMEGMHFPFLGLELPLQGLAVLALLPIWLYRGEKGSRSRLVQMGSYLFYPVHMLILGIIGYFF